MIGMHRFIRREEVSTLLLACMLALTTTFPSYAGKHYALVVGVSSYRAGQPLPPLPYTENDANGLAEVLKAGGYDVTLMTQTVGRTKGKEVLAPLSDYIRDQISAILDNPFLKDDDVIIVAFAGHGVQYEMVDANGNKNAKFYFCPADADIRRLKTAEDISERNRLIDLGELYTALKNSRAGGKLLLVDACRNDPNKPGVARSVASATLPPLPPPPGGTAAFFSCSAHQQAFEDAQLRHGVFFHHVIEALQGDADSSTTKRAADGQITLAELSEYASSSTYDFVRRKYQGARQAPELKGEFRISIPLISVKRSPSSEVPKTTPPLSAETTSNEFTNSIGMKLVLIKAGTFMMGSPASEADREDDEAQHRVTLTKDNYLGTTEVTQGQWAAVMGTTPWRGKGFVKEGSNYAATYVSWDDAVEFCKKLSSLDGKSYRLPTEAEWEYACRGGTTTAYSFGVDASQLSRYAFFDENAWDQDEKYAHQVGQKLANPFGLYDMHGNVFEWCSDWKGDYPSGSVTDPRGPSGGSNRVYRGGSWNYNARYCRSANRYNNSPGNRINCLGFRVAVGR